MIGLVLIFFRVNSGLSVVNMYSSMIFKRSGYNPLFGTFLVGLVNLAGSVIPNFFLNKVGRKTLICISLLLGCIFNLLVTIGTVY